MPAYILLENKVTRKSFDDWITLKKISSSRENIQTVFDEYNVRNTRELFIKNYGLSLTDHYWIKPSDENIKWENINCFENKFSAKMGDILIGDGIKKEEDGISPESTSGGALPKKWEQREDGIYLIRKSPTVFAQDPFNEVIANEIMNRLNINNVEYKIEWKDSIPNSVCKNFLKNDQELIHAFELAHIIDFKGERYNTFLTICQKNNIVDIKKNLDEMITLDYIIGNTDRHFNNFGFIRNTKTLRFEGFAPIYDSGNSLWYDEHERAIKVVNDIRSRPFKSSHDEQIRKADLSQFDFDKLKNIPDFINDTLKENDRITEARRNLLAYGTKCRIENLKYLQARFEKEKEHE